ncbi:MAG: competence/damage-inducible protein A [Deferribacteres bacterium]|nr:competence/damage-inducible protein A [candidate division KSB1 bacterium]MCB9502957.1 competence/damage-inducible protein A [Deferribacteres bacterium]
MIRCEIISIGDELLIGQTVNTNASWMGSKLSEIGIPVKRVTTISDEREAIIRALDKALAEFELVLVTGGLGPTHDDITKAVVTDYFGTELVYHETIYENLKKRFEARGYKFPESNAGQAWLPKDAEILSNMVGSAQGMLFEKKGRYCVVMPGVPAEMRYLMENSVLPIFAARNIGNVIMHHTWRTTGIPESLLFELLGDISEIEQYGKLAFLPKFSGVDIRLSVYAETVANARKNVQSVERMILNRAGEYVFSTGDTPLEKAIADKLLDKKRTVAVAESCTGGLLGKKLTDIAGSSSWFLGGVIAYSNEQKMKILGVPPELLEKYGAVSSEVAEIMAQNIKKICATDFGISITGIAGPSGGSDEKPVGLVYIGFASPEGVVVKKHIFGRERELNRERSAHAACQLLYEALA